MAKRSSYHNTVSDSTRHSNAERAAAKKPEQKMYTKRLRGCARSTAMAQHSVTSTGSRINSAPFTPIATRS
ncbi:hypothetical protein D3C72_2338070 [compost metagenome]